MTKLQIAISGALAMTGVAGLAVQGRANAALRDEVASLRQDGVALAALRTENTALARTTAEVADMRRDDAELVRLRDEAAALRVRAEGIAAAEKKRTGSAGGIVGMIQVFDPSKLDQQPVARLQPGPQYPFEMRRAGIAGEVVVDFVIDTEGDVQQAYAIRSSQREFEAAAVAAVGKWKFKAGRKDGRDVHTHMQVPIVFSLAKE